MSHDSVIMIRECLHTLHVLFVLSIVYVKYCQTNVTKKSLLVVIIDCMQLLFSPVLVLVFF